MNKLNCSGLREDLEHLVLQKKVPILGVCVGMQMLSDCSEEGDLPGLVDTSSVRAFRLIHALQIWRCRIWVEQNNSN